MAGPPSIGSGGGLGGSALSTINQTGSGFLLESGSATFNGGIRTANADCSVIRIDGGTFTATAVELRLTQSYTALRTTTDVNQSTPDRLRGTRGALSAVKSLASRGGLCHKRRK